MESCLTILRQLLRTFLVDGSRIMKGLMPAVSFFVGLKRTGPLTIPKDACWRSPGVFWNLLSDFFLLFAD